MNQSDSPRVTKRLSDNDVSATGGHQAGILVPKAEDILAFFPRLPKRESLNPRAAIAVREELSGTRWMFNFIYYNNRYFGGTRNEYRLTCMTRYLRASNAVTGDDLTFAKDSNGSIVISLCRANAVGDSQPNPGVLVLSGGWKIINY